MRICYLNINASYSHSSLALPLLHAASEAQFPCAWTSVRGTIKDDANALAADVVAREPDVVLATGYLFNHTILIRTLRRVHALRRDCCILLGGPEFLGHNEAFLKRESFITAVFRGEGEDALPQILRTLHERSTWSTIAGMCWIDEEGVYRDNGKAQLDAHRWHQLPPPTASSFFDWSKPFIQLETSRGCAQMCSFCTSYRTGAARWLPQDRVCDILQEARAHGVREIRVLDRTFNASPRGALERLLLFCEAFGELRFHLEIHPAFLTDELKAAFVAAPPGLLHLEVGLQTTHPEALVASGRAGSPERNWAGLAFLCGCPNLDVHVDLIGGLPRLPLAHLAGDLSAISKLKPAEIQLEILKVLPGTPVEADARKYGLVYAPDPPYEVLETPEMSVQDVQTVMHLSRIVDRYYNTPVLQPAVIAAVEGLPDFYMAFLGFLRQETDLRSPLSLERRALLLHRFLCETHSTAAEGVAYLWIRAGLSPERAPGKTCRWKDPIPDAAVLVEGCDTYRDTRARVWMLRRTEQTDWFVFDRAVERSRPVAVYQLEA